MSRQVLNEMEYRVGAAGAASGTTDVASAVVDTAGCESVVFAVRIATKADGNYLSVAQGAKSDLSDGADLAGSKVATANDGEVAAVEIFKPAERYLKATIKRGTATATGDLIAIRKMKKEPASNNVASSIVSEIYATPDEGTA